MWLKTITVQWKIVLQYSRLQLMKMTKYPNIYYIYVVLKSIFFLLIWSKLFLFNTEMSSAIFFINVCVVLGTFEATQSVTLFCDQTPFFE
jgi:hypothetical protein